MQIDIGNGRKIVLFDVMGDKQITNNELISNFYCIVKDYTVLWQVKEAKTQPPFENDGFAHLVKNEKGEIIADRFSGFEYKIDSITSNNPNIYSAKIIIPLIALSLIISFIRWFWAVNILLG